MLSQSLRPQTFEDVAGQAENIKILKAILKNPENSPKSLIFEGAFGSGKTTCARIMARKLNNITDTSYDLLNSPFYYEYDSTVVGNVEEIRRLRDTFSLSYGDYWRIIVFDECMSYDTPITLADGSQISIGELVSEEKEVEVMSYNSALGVCEPKKVIGWFKNSPKIFYTVKTTKQQGGVLRASENHVFITPLGEKRLNELTIGSKIYRYEYKLSEDERQVILGTLLGDASIGRLNGKVLYNPRIAMAHGASQLNWLNLKCDMLRNIMANAEGYIVSEGKNPDKCFPNSSNVTHRDTKSLMCLREFSQLFYDIGHKSMKRVTLDILKQLSPLGLAVWYLDDGNLNQGKRKHVDGSYGYSNVITLHTEGFTLDECNIICDYFKTTWGITFNPYTYNGYTYIIANREGSEKFLDLVTPYICDEILDYKVGELRKCGNGFRNIEHGSMNAIEDTITSISLYNNIPEDSYDIEVEDNHNYFGGGILVHNCHSISNVAQTALLKILEEVKGKNIFILATTHAHKLLPTIRSRSLELKFVCVPTEEIIANITKVAEEHSLSIPEDIKEIIANRSNGHMRNAHMLLDKYLLLGDVDFRDSIKSSIDLYCRYLEGIYKDDKQLILDSLNALLNIPKDELQQDFNLVMTESMKAFNGFDIAHKSIKDVVALYGKSFSAVVNCYLSNWFLMAFTDMCYFQATFLQVYNQVSNVLKNAQQQSSASAVNAPNRFSSNMVRR